MREVIERCRDNLNVVRVGDHHGFYKHADVEALLSSHSALLEALIRASSWIDGLPGKNSSHMLRDDHVASIHAAIAKATGADQ